ncbi:MAG: hypothetical protein ORN24_02415 [Burkholderiales bacterium]|nr:hypothetical protein [Burkholderiales bacterium]
MRFLLISILFVICNLCNANSFITLNYLNKIDHVSIATNESTAISTLYFNNKIIKTSNDFAVLYLVGKAQIESFTVYIIWGGAGGTIDEDTDLHYQFLTINEQNQYKLSSVASEAYANQIYIESNNLRIRTINPAPYAEKNDLGWYEFFPQNNKIVITAAVKSEDYYSKKFASYTVAQIFAQMKADNCYSIDNNKLFFPHVCGWGYGYCYMLSKIKLPIKNDQYKLLAQSCSNH